MNLLLRILYLFIYSSFFFIYFLCDLIFPRYYTRWHHLSSGFYKIPYFLDFFLLSDTSLVDNVTFLNSRCGHLVFSIFTSFVLHWRSVNREVTMSRKECLLSFYIIFCSVTLVISIYLFWTEVYTFNVISKLSAYLHIKIC